MSTQSGQGPDLSRIVSLIMQNPDLIKQIEALAGKNAEEENSPAAIEPSVTKEAETVKNDLPAITASTTVNKREKRTHLLSALRPYISEKRGKTIDTLLGAMDLWDLVGKG